MLPGSWRHRCGTFTEEDRLLERALVRRRSHVERKHLLQAQAEVVTAHRPRCATDRAVERVANRRTIECEVDGGPGRNRQQRQTIRPSELVEHALRGRDRCLAAAGADVPFVDDEDDVPFGRTVERGRCVLVEVSRGVRGAHAGRIDVVDRFNRSRLAVDVSLKSAAVRSRTGRPDASTTTASASTMSTPALKRG